MVQGALRNGGALPVTVRYYFVPPLYPSSPSCLLLEIIHKIIYTVLSMPSVERTRPSEHEPAPYHRAARFSREGAAWHVYQQLQGAIYSTPQCDLSVYRLQLDRIYHVAVLGEPPPVELDQRISQLLAQGEAVTLPREALMALTERRRQTIHLGGWVERHHRPGERL